MEEDLNINMRNSRQGLLGGSVVKNPPANTGDTVQSLSQEIVKDREAWRGP